jgi:Uma2 family endonuclease
MQKLLQFMPKTARLITADELERMSGDERHELVKGRLVRMSRPGYLHARVATGLSAMLHNYVKPRRLGEVLVELGCKLESNPDTVRGPDIAFIRQERTPQATRGFWNGSPDLVVEVLSPNDRRSEVREKIDDYLTHGVVVVLVVDPDVKVVTVHRRLTVPATLHGSDELDLDDVVSGFRCAVSEIFE